MKLEEALKVSEVQHTIDQTRKPWKASAKRLYDSNLGYFIVSTGVNQFIIVNSEEKPITRNPELYFSMVQDFTKELYIGQKCPDDSFLSDKVLGKEDWEPF